MAPTQTVVILDHHSKRITERKLTMKRSDGEQDLVRPPDSRWHQVNSQRSGQRCTKAGLMIRTNIKSSQ